MNARPAVLAVLLAVAALPAACGGSDAPTLQVQRGLAAAALGAASEKGGPQGPFLGGLPQGASGAGGDIGSGGPALQQGQTGVTVQGYGSATAPADSALLELYFEKSTPSNEAPFTEEDLQPIIDALVFQNVPRDDIDLLFSPKYDKYAPGSATLRATVGDAGALDAIIDDVNEAVESMDWVRLINTSALYTVSDCASLDRAALEAAVRDARDRGAIFGQALAVTLGPVIGASHYTYSYYGPNPCDPSAYPYGPYGGGGQPYVRGQPAEVRLSATVSVTFAIQ